VEAAQALRELRWPPDSDQGPQGSVGAFLPAYLDFLASAGMAAHTTAATRLDLLQLARFLGRQPVRAVGLDDLRAFFLWLARQQGNSVSSLRRKTSTVKRFFRQLHADALIEGDPSAGLVYPAAESAARDAISADEARAVVEAARDPTWRALLLALLDAGLKRDEAVALRWEDVEPPTSGQPEGRLHIRHRRSSKRVRHRTLAMTSALAEALATIKPADPEDLDGPVFGISARGIDFIVETCGKRAGVRPDEKITPQMLRDAFACGRVREFKVREAPLAQQPAALVEARREHNRLLIRELGLSAASAAPDRYRSMVERLEADRAKERPLEHR
jgi:site-specific recombinase XerD